MAKANISCMGNNCYNIDIVRSTMQKSWTNTIFIVSVHFNDQAFLFLVSLQTEIQVMCTQFFTRAEVCISVTIQALFWGRRSWNH